MEQELKDRTKQFALRIMNLVDALPKTTSTIAIGRQIIRSETSVGANYRGSMSGQIKGRMYFKAGNCSGRS